MSYAHDPGCNTLHAGPAPCPPPRVIPPPTDGNDMTDQAMESNCEHAYATRVRGGEPVSVRACSLCGQPDWPDLRQQVEQLCAAAALEAQHRTALAFQPDDPLRRPSAEQQRLFLEQFARDYPGVDPELPAIPADPRKAG